MIVQLCVEKRYTRSSGWQRKLERAPMTPVVATIRLLRNIREFKKFTMAARFEFLSPPHTRPCRLERVHTPTAHLLRKCSNGAFCTSKQHISERRNDRVLPQTRGGRPHRSGARPTARPQQQQQHQQPQHQQQTAAQQQHYKFAELRLNFGVGVLQRAAGAGGR
jgi:hypothetical protein